VCGWPVISRLRATGLHSDDGRRCYSATEGFVDTEF
jgi:hypothetical protein